MPFTRRRRLFATHLSRASTGLSPRACVEMGSWMCATLALSACAPAALMTPQAPAGVVEPLRTAAGLLEDGQVYVAGDHYRIQSTGDLAITAASAQSEANGLPVAALSDGDLATPWANAGYRDATTWAQVGWGAQLSLTSLQIKTGPSAPGTWFDLLVSGDGTTWTPVATQLTNTSWTPETKLLPPGTVGQFLRVLWHNSQVAPIPRFAIYELAVQGGGLVGPVPAPLPTPVPSPLPVPGPIATPSPTPVPPNSPPTSAPVFTDLPTSLPQVVPGGPVLLPDLSATPPVNLWLQRNWGGGGSIHFSNTIANIGAGAFVVTGSLATDGVHTDATQELLDAQHRIVAIQDIGLFAYHPTHHHFHVADVSLYELRATSPTGPVVATSQKVSFCLDDSLPIRNPAPLPMYRTCTPVVQGVDPGWADLYPGNLDGQSLDVTGLAAGSYYLVITVDPTNKFVDANRTNNVAWLKVTFDASAGTLISGDSSATVR
jgi:hypothetical protein